MLLQPAGEKSIGSWRPHMCLNSIQTVCIASCPGSLYILIDDLCNPCGGEPGDEATVHDKRAKAKIYTQDSFLFFQRKNMYM